METEFIIRNILVGISLLFLFSLIMKEEQNADQNWAMFYSTLWVLISLPVVNAVCVSLNLWHFGTPESESLMMPYDLLFVWVVVWGVVPTFFAKGKYVVLLAAIAFWSDIILMPQLEVFDILFLGENWYWGELMLVLFVFVPGQLWAKFSIEKTNIGLRTMFQFFSIAIIYCLGIPCITMSYFPQFFNLNLSYAMYISQLAFIFLLPALVALLDLKEEGKGTPFPYDPTPQLVRSGVYAYIRNPIQWALTLFFIPLAVLYGAPILLVGVVVSVAYTLGVSNPQEFESMEKRFGKDWTAYKASVPSWRFLWRPNNIPKGTMYFKKNCNECSEFRRWFEKQNGVNLFFEHAEDFKGKQLLQVTYVTKSGQEYTSVEAIARGFEHINLVYASLGWVMRLPGITFFIQAIVDGMGLKDEETSCGIDGNMLNDLKQ